MQVFNFFGSIFGYVLWAFYFLVRNYGVAILLFTILIKAVLFPLSVKQQRSMAASGKIAEKQKILAEKYKNDKAKYQEEVQKLYAQEGTSPGSGCLITLIPFPIMMGLYYTVISPLSNALHIASDSIQRAVLFLEKMPGISASFSSRFPEMEILRNFDTLEPLFRQHNVFNDAEMDTIGDFSHSFNFLGLNLLDTPSTSGFVSMMWLIPLFCLLLNIGTQVYMMFTNDSMKNQQGCMKVTMLLMPLLTAVLAFTMPGAIGFYWICNGLAMFGQTVLMNYFFSRDHMTANVEARRIARRVMEEARVKVIPVSQRKVFADPSPQAGGAKGSGQAKQGSGKSNKKKKR